MTFDWTRSTDPFTALDGSRPATITLRQVSDNTFTLQAPIRFHRPDGGPDLVVRPDLLGHTDLASIPSFLGWFARRHGRHTPAALLHDQLVTRHQELLPPDQRVPRTEADATFREALAASGVPPVRCWLMWTAVTLTTRCMLRPWGLVGIAAWFVVAVAGTVLLGLAAAAGDALLVAIAVVAPVVAALLWGRQFRAGVIAGYAFWPAVLGSVPSRVAYWTYLAAEHAVRLTARMRSAQVPPPPSYRQR